MGSAEVTLQVREEEKVYAELRSPRQIPKIQLNGVDMVSEETDTVASGIYEVK